MAKTTKLPSPLKMKPPKMSSALSKINRPSTKAKMEYPNITQYTGAKSTAQSAAEGRLKVAASSKYKPILKASIKKAKEKAGYLKM